MWIKVGRSQINLDHVRSIDLGDGPGDPVTLAVDYPCIFRQPGGPDSPSVMPSATFAGAEADALRAYLAAASTRAGMGLVDLTPAPPAKPAGT